MYGLAAPSMLGSRSERFTLVEALGGMPFVSHHDLSGDPRTFGRGGPADMDGCYSTQAMENIGPYRDLPPQKSEG